MKFEIIFNVPTYGLINLYWGKEHINPNWGLQWSLCLIPMSLSQWWKFGKEEDIIYPPTLETKWHLGPLGYIRKLSILQ